MKEKSSSNETAKKKSTFKLPHLLWIMFGLIVIVSLLTYVIPAGTFGVDANGKLLGDEFSYVGHQTPVSPWRAAMLILDGFTGSALVICMVITAGASINVTLDTGAVDKFINWAIFKLKDKGSNTLVPIFFIMMVYLGGFGGGDSFVAFVPIGLVFARKMKLDPIVALGITTFATMLGFGVGPTRVSIAQMMLEIPPYSGFGARFLAMNFFMIIALFYLMKYVKRIEKNPAASFMGDTKWLYDTDPSNIQEPHIEETSLNWQTIAIVLILFGKYILMVWYTMVIKKNQYAFIVAINILSALVSGLIGKLSGDQIGNSFAKGIGNMAFVGFVIGLARVVSLVMEEGQIVHTIVYVLSRPLLTLDKGLTAIGISMIIAVINPLIPSATSKAAILIPIIQPITEALNIHPQIATSAFQYGDGFTNLISPVLGWTIGSLVVAKVPFNKWLKWVTPIMVIMILLSFVWIYVLSLIGWTGL